MLKQQFQPELHDARIVGLCQRAEIRCGAGDLDGSEIGVVEKVEDLRAELQPHALVDVGPFHQREVPVLSPGHFDQITRQRTDQTDAPGEGIGVDPVIG